MFTYRDLKAIQEGNRRNQDVMDLLREVKRLRELAALTYSVIAYVSMGGLSQEARVHFKKHDLHRDYSDSNEVAPYMQDGLKGIVDRY